MAWRNYGYRRRRRRFYYRPRPQFRRAVRRVVQNMAETKEKMYSTTTSPTAAWAGMEPAAIAMGGAADERIGHDIFLKGIRIKGHFLAGTSAGNVYNFRLVVAWNKNHTGAVNFPVSLLTPCNPDDNDVLRDKIYTCTRGETVSTVSIDGPGVQKFVDIWIPLNRKYRFTGNAIGDNAEENTLVVAWLTDNPTGTPGWDMQTHLYYTDI